MRHCGPLGEDVFLLAVTQTESAVGGGEATAARSESLALSRHDINRDGSISPIDALLVVNASAELRAEHAISEEAFAAFDVNGDGVLATDDIESVVEQLDALGRDASQEESTDERSNQAARGPNGNRGTSRLHVASFQNIASRKFITLESQSHSFVGVESRPRHAEQARTGTDVGLIAFEVHDVQPGSVVEVRVVLPADSAPVGYLHQIKGQASLIGFGPACSSKTPAP